MGKGGGSAEAALARRDEEERQARIRGGRERINSIFDGGSYGTGQVERGTRYDPNQTYYTADGQVYERPTGVDALFGGGSGMNWNQALKEGLYTGIETAEGFGDGFFDDRRQSYIDFARPQVDKQFGDANEQLTYALARAGTMDSSIAGEEGAELQRQYDINLQDIVDKARQYETDARNSIEDARSDLMTMLQATGDATGAANAAIARAGALSQTPAYSPVGQLFTDFTAGLSQQAALERAEAATGRDYARYDTGLFGAPANAVKVR